MRNTQTAPKFTPYKPAPSLGSLASPKYSEKINYNKFNNK